MTHRRLKWLVLLSVIVAPAARAQRADTTTVLLEPAAVFDGDSLRAGWVVVVKGDRIVTAGSATTRPAAAGRRVPLPGLTLVPGLIEAHSHLLLHPYNEAPWNDQVLKEALALRIARATVHAKNTLLAGFTTVRDLGTEGADYADVGLKQAVEQGIVPGPGSSPPPARSWRPGAMPPRGSILAGRSLRAPTRRMESTS